MERYLLFIGGIGYLMLSTISFYAFTMIVNIPIVK